MKTKELDLTVVDFITFLELPQDVRIVQNGSTLYTGSIARIPSVILNEKALPSLVGLFISVTPVL